MPSHNRLKAALPEVDQNTLHVAYFLYSLGGRYTNHHQPGGVLGVGPGVSTASIVYKEQCIQRMHAG